MLITVSTLKAMTTKALIGEMKSADRRLYSRFLRAAASFSIVFGAIIFAVAVFVTMRSFPLVEGWHEALVYLENSGRSIYKDTEFVLPPMVYWFAKGRYLIVGDSFF